MRKQYVRSLPLYKKRQEIIAQIPHFWPLAFEQSPPEIDQFIQPTDSEIFGTALTNLSVSRFEIPVDDADSTAGNPRSVSVRMEFAENEWFTDTVLEKRFWYRRAEDGWTGLVSEPVKINWKKGQDPTQGLTDAAYKLWEARKKAGDMAKRDLPEYKALAKLVNQWNGGNTSFFTWFGFVSAKKWVSAEESEKATKEEEERRRKRKSGEKVEDPEMSEEDDQDVEVHEAGDDLANLIAEDFWPSAIKYFTQAQEAAEMSDFDFEDDDEDMESESGEDEPVDIRSLVQGKGKKVKAEAEPPKKKQKK